MLCNMFSFFFITKIQFILIINVQLLVALHSPALETGAALNKNDDGSSLKMINILFRHGDRAPIDYYPNDPHLNYSWHNGIGGLSKKGSLQLFNLGKIMRKQYKQLMPTDGLYSNNNMKILSSSVERCLMSAASFLAGFMPPLSVDVANNHHSLPILWQPIPIYATNENDILLTHLRACPQYDKLLLNQLLIYHSQGLCNSDETKQQNYEIYNDLTKYTGQNVISYFDVESLHDTLKVQQDNNLLLPNWTVDVFPRMTEPFYNNAIPLRTTTKFMKKIKGGPILTEFIENIKHYLNGELNTKKKIHIYSAHDTTIGYLINALEIMELFDKRPDYGASIVFELHYNNVLEYDYEIKIQYYYNSYDEYPTEILIPNCIKPCALNHFITSVQELLINDSDYNNLCAL